MNVLKIFKTHPDIVLPRHQTSESACFDIAFQRAGKSRIHGYSNANKPVERITDGSLTISPGDRILVPTGLILDIPKGYSVRVHARSGLSVKQGLVLANAEGVVDSDYIDELFIILYNISGNSVTIRDGDRIAQGELVKNEEYTIEQTPARPIPKTNRTGGFGSTGIITKQDTIIINIPETNTRVTKEPENRGRGRPKKNARSSS